MKLPRIQFRVTKRSATIWWLITRYVILYDVHNKTISGYLVACNSVSHNKTISKNLVAYNPLCNITRVSKR